MNQNNRLSPVTIYYLRKIIQRKQNELVFCGQKLSHPQTLNRLFYDLVRPSVERAISLDALDGFVRLHQSLRKKYDYNCNSLVVLNVESQIFEILGIQSLDCRKNESSCDSTQDGLCRSETVASVKNLTTCDPSNKLNAKRCFDLLQQLNQLRQESNSLIGPEATCLSLEETRPKDQWLQNFNIVKEGSITYQGDIHEVILDRRLRVYKSWTDAFSQKCKSIAQRLHEIKLCQTAERQSENNRERHIQSVLNDFSKTANLKRISVNRSPIRCRSLLKHFNDLIKKGQLLIGEQSVRACLQNSCPDDAWCHMFEISESMTMTYRGNLTEIVTHTRLKIYEQWISTFTQKCSSQVVSENQKKRVLV